MLALALLVGLALPAGAAPYTAVGTGDSVAVTESLAAIDGPSHHFGFTQASVLAQSTSQQTLIPTGGSGQLVTTGTACTQTINTSCNGTIAGGTILYNKSGSGTVFITVTDPANAVAGSGKVIFAATTAGTLTVTPGVTAGATCNPATVTAGTVETCQFTITNGDLLAGNSIVVSFLTTAGVVNLVGTVNAATGTGVSPTAATAQPVLAGLGFTGNAANPCGIRIGTNCIITGGATGNATIISSATWTLNVAAAPAGALAGVAPVAFALTTTNTVNPGEGPFPCTALAAVGAATTCTFTTVGNPLVGLTVAVCFATAAAPACVLGSVAAGAGAAVPLVLPNLPILPPPPLEFIPPPPPPLLPPPPPAPTGAMAAPRAAFPDVPVIPEADSLFLVIGGLVALGGLVGYRRLRRRDDDA
jgi:hypothetical protein